jgi:hypothetical protein
LIFHDFGLKKYFKRLNKNHQQEPTEILQLFRCFKWRVNIGKGSFPKILARLEKLDF